jgi:hypothetical protein
MGELPGDLPRRIKIAMLEGNVPIQAWPWQTINEKCAKSFRKDHHKKTEKRFRRNMKKEIEDENAW